MVDPLSPEGQQRSVANPMNWWGIGLVALGALVAVLLVMQLMTSGPATDVVPGTPVVERSPEAVSPPPVQP